MTSLGAGAKAPCLLDDVRVWGCYSRLTVARSLQNYLAMSWIKPELRLNAPIQIYASIINAPNTSSTSSSNLTTPQQSLEPTTALRLKHLQGHVTHLRDILPALPAPQN